MKKIIVFLFLISSFVGFSQEDAWVYFIDKPNSATFFSNPLSELSQRALDRRTAQGIALDIKDVPVYQSYIDQVTASNGIIVKAKSKWMNCLHVRGLQADIEALKLLSFVSSVDFADKTLNVSRKKTTAKLKFKPVNKVLQTTVNFNYGNSANQIQMLNGHLLHQSNFTGTGIIIAVLDAGFPGVDTAQPFQRLITNGSILGGYNYVTKSTNFYNGHSHGTSVLSLIGGYTEGQLIGSAPDAQYYLYITEDVASENPVEESNWVEAAEEADRVGVDIITSSLGYFDFDGDAYDHIYADMTGNAAFASKGANIAFSKGIVVLASAGNEGASLTEPHVGVPAEAQNVIAVGAVDASENYASFSSIGPSFDNRVKPDVTAQGQNPYVYSGGTINNSGNGTSYSCPIVAGMVACLWQALPGKTNAQIKQLITQSADNFNPIVKSRPQYGYGIPDFSLALANGLSVSAFTKNDFLVYPNPTADSISITLPEGFDSKTIAIYNVLGQKVLEKNISTQSLTISLKSLNSGMYFYQLETNLGTKTGKIIKN